MPSDIQTLQKDTIKLLEGVGELMQKARDVLRDDAERYEGYRKNISNQLDNVKNLELRMSIVAPMKAGKSTIVNAILGQKLLPSRSSAMTTLPTEIAFKGNIDNPQLILSPSFIQPFGTALSELKTSLEQRQDVAEIEPSLKPLIKNIKTDSLTISALIQSEDSHVYQDEKINEVLEELNDIIRLCGYFNLIENPLNFLRESLQIEVPAKVISDSVPGNFVIVDTPGPNEAGGNSQLLSEVVSMQLQRSSLVLVVIDFTQHQTIAADKVKQEVEKIVNVRGKKSLYVVINKVDQRKAGDPSPEELVQQIASQFKIEPKSIFELSAWRAFIVRNFLREFEQNPNGNIHDESQYPSLAEASSILAQELFPIAYNRRFKDSTASLLKEGAEELIELTGFDELYSNALESMLFASAPTSLEIALNLCKNQLADLKATIALNQSASQNDITTLQSNLEELQKKLDQINSLREGQYEKERAKQQFQAL